MSQMFYGAEKFNVNISNWNISSQITDMSYMFFDAFKFNSPLNTKEVTLDMSPEPDITYTAWNVSKL